VGYKADLQNLKTSHTSLREKLTKHLPPKDKKKKLPSLPNHLARLRQSFCLNTNTRTWCWRRNTRTTKTEILLFLNLEFFYVFVCLPPLPVDFFGFLFFFFFLCFVSFTIVS
jgi:hypothetical protein